MHFHLGENSRRNRIQCIPRVLGARPEAGDWTKAVTVEGGSAEAEEDESIFQDLFLRMRALRWIDMQCLFCSEPMLNHILLSKPHTLRLHTVWFPATTRLEDWNEFQKQESIFTLRLEFHPPHTQLAVYHSFPTGIQFILVSSVSTLTLTAGATTLAYQLLERRPQHIFVALRILFLDHPRLAELNSFITLLAACQNLEELHLSRPVPSEEFVPAYTLPAESLPALSRFSGTLVHAQAIIPQRPLTNVFLYTKEDAELSDSALMHVFQSSAAVTDACISTPHWDDSYPAVLAKCLPRVRHLIVTFRS